MVSLSLTLKTGNLTDILNKKLKTKRAGYRPYLHSQVAFLSTYYAGEEAKGSFDMPRIADTERIRALMELGDNMNLSSLQKAITFYKSCVDTDAVEKQSLSSLHEFLSSLGTAGKNVI